MSKVLDYLERVVPAAKIRLSGENAVCPCPFHSDRTPSFSMNLVNGLFICFACGAQGNFVKFLRDGIGMSLTGAMRVAEDLDLAVVEEDFEYLPPYEKRMWKASDEKVESERLLAVYDFCPRYMLKRGFTKETLKQWEIGYDFESACVTIPVRDAEGRLVGFSRRKTSGASYPKYLHLFKRGAHLYGLHCRAGHDCVMVTDGQLDTIAASQLLKAKAGVLFEAVGNCLPVSTMGGSVGKGQLKFLRTFKKVVLFPDQEASGRGDAWAGYIGERLLPFYSPSRLVVAMVQGINIKDVADMLNSPATIRVQPYVQWRLTLS